MSCRHGGCGHRACGCCGCGSRAYCTACSDQTAQALGELALAPLVALGVVLAWLARRPLAALVLLVTGVVVVLVAGVLS